MQLNIFLVSISVLALVVISCSSAEQDCPINTRPAVPVLIDVIQDPETLMVTATVRDESDNEQWFALERALNERVNLFVVVGTDIPVSNADSLPIDIGKGRTVVIKDRGVIVDQIPEPGEEYVYAVRAWNCSGASGRSNDIKILSLYPRDSV